MGKMYKCIKCEQNEFTVGKVYEVDEHGFVTSDDGWIWFPCEYEDACQWCNEESEEIRFEEVVFAPPEKTTKKTFDSKRLYKCTTTNSKSFTVGKVYTLDENGNITDDDGWNYTPCGCDNACEWLNTYSDTHFEKVVVKMPKITVKVEGNKTIAKMWMNGKLIKERWCVCHESDEFDYATGVQIAVARLFDWDYARRKVDD